MGRGEAASRASSVANGNPQARPVSDSLWLMVVAVLALLHGHLNWGWAPKKTMRSLGHPHARSRCHCEVGEHRTIPSIHPSMVADRLELI